MENKDIIKGILSGSVTEVKEGIGARMNTVITSKLDEKKQAIAHGYFGQKGNDSENS